MARVTVEDCIENIPDRFELVALAAQRARQIASGNPILVERDNDKDTVVSLREIAENKVSPAVLREEVILSYQKLGKKDIIDDVKPGFGAGARQDINDELTSLQSVDEDDLEDADLNMEFGGEDEVNADD